MTEDKATGDYGQFNAVDQVQAFNIVEQSQIQQSVLPYTEFLVSRYAKDSVEIAENIALQNLRLTGSMKGIFILPLPDDFDEPLEEFEEYIDAFGQL